MLRDFGPLDRTNWPIAAAMIQYGNVLPDGRSVQDQSEEGWASTLAEITDAGFTEIDPTDCWLRVADLAPARLDAFKRVLADAGLTVPAISTSRRNLTALPGSEPILAYAHRVLDAAAALGARSVCLGTFGALNEAQQAALWFWTVQGEIAPTDPAIRSATIRRFRELGHHASEVGVDIAIEMYEDSYAGTADDAVRFVEEIDHPSVGLNPDLGNLVRLHRPMEHWQSMMAKVAPFAKYWHAKNYSRTEDATTGLVVTAPQPLEFGVINYRAATAMAIEAGFRGGFGCEHYGGDGLSVSATNRNYLRRILPRTPV